MVGGRRLRPTVVESDATIQALVAVGEVSVIDTCACLQPENTLRGLGWVAERHCYS